MTGSMSISLSASSQHPKAVLKHFMLLWHYTCAFGEQVMVGQQAEPCAALPAQECILLNFSGDHSVLRSCAPAAVGRVSRDRAVSAVSAVGEVLLHDTSFSWYFVKLTREQEESLSDLIKTSTLSSFYPVQHKAGAVSRSSFSCNLSREIPTFG